jgi:hypothetical protein
LAKSISRAEAVIFAVPLGCEVKALDCGHIQHINKEVQKMQR